MKRILPILFVVLFASCAGKKAVTEQTVTPTTQTTKPSTKPTKHVDKEQTEMLRRIARHLAPGGRIVIAIENRLGLKYWAGCTEDHVGKYFEGLENYPDTRSVRTFSRKELSDIIDQAGEFKTTFYYPYPDYKFPMTIYSDKRLPKKGELRDNFCNFDRNRIQLFNEGKVYDSLTDAGLFQEFSNSFLVIVERKENK